MNHETPSDVFPNTLLSKLRSPHSSLDVRDQVSEPYQTTGNIQPHNLLSYSLQCKQGYKYVKILWIIAD